MQDLWIIVSVIPSTTLCVKETMKKIGQSHTTKYQWPTLLVDMDNIKPRGGVIIKNTNIWDNVCGSILQAETLILLKFGH